MNAVTTKSEHMRFKVKAYEAMKNTAPSVLQLDVEAVSAQAAARQVSDQGYSVLSVQAQSLTFAWGLNGSPQALRYCFAKSYWLCLKRVWD